MIKCAEKDDCKYNHRGYLYFVEYDLNVDEDIIKYNNMIDCTEDDMEYIKYQLNKNIIEYKVTKHLAPIVGIAIIVASAAASIARTENAAIGLYYYFTRK